jgi:hypothetical protein
MPRDVEGTGAGEAGFGSEGGEESVDKLTEIEPDTNVTTPITRRRNKVHRITPRNI